MDTFFHVRMLMSIIMGLSMAQLLKNTVKLIDNPKRARSYAIHLLWVLYVFLLLIHFWWWEIHLKNVSVWTFPIYVFVLLYVILYYIICVVISPDDISEYSGYEEYFFSRKNWFFSLLAICYVLDFVDTMLKGMDYFKSLNWEYPVRNILHVFLCFAGMKLSSKRSHLLLVIFFILYELVFIVRRYYS
jgi:hypothetical protein